MTRPWISRRMKRKDKRAIAHFIRQPGPRCAARPAEYPTKAWGYMFCNGSRILIADLDKPACLIGGPNIAEPA